jgi:hypothetical protein
MRKHFCGWAAVCAVLAIAGTTARAQEVPQGYVPPLGWYATLDTLILNRSIKDTALMIDSATGKTLFDASKVLEFGPKPAPSFTLGKILDDTLSVEASFLGCYGWHARGWTALDGVNGPTAQLPFPNLFLPFAGGETQSYEYRSDMTNIDLSLRQRLGNGFSALYGFHYLNLTENFSGTLNDATGAFFGDYRTRTSNNLYGLQLGGEYTRWFGNMFNITFHGKASLDGAYEKQGTNGSFLSGPFYTPDGRTATIGKVAYTAQTGIRTSLQLTDRLALRTGYQVMWIGGVALAPNQAIRNDWIFPNAAAGISSGSALFMHGALVGLEYVW